MEFTTAKVDGLLGLSAPTGALLLGGDPLLLNAERLRLDLVHVQKDYVENPLGNDFALIGEKQRLRDEWEGATLELLEAEERTVVYAFQDELDRGTFGLDLGMVNARPFTSANKAVALHAAERDQSYGFTHEVPGPHFGVSTGLPGPFRSHIGSVRVAGNFSLLLDYVAFRVFSHESTQEFRTGSWRTSETSLGPLTPAYHAERAYALLTVENGTLLVGEPSRARFLTADPAYDLRGSLQIPRASGALRLPEGSSQEVDGSLEIVGNLTVRVSAEESGSNLLPTATGPGRLHARVDGEASEIRLAGIVVSRSLPPEAQTLSVVAVIASILVLAWGHLQKLGAPFLLPLYARLTGKTLLSNECRLAVYRTIDARPFIHVREIKRRTGLGYGT